MKTHNLLHSWGPGIDNRDWGGLSPRIRLVLACFGYPDQTTHLRLGQLRVAGGATKGARPRRVVVLVLAEGLPHRCTRGVCL